MIKINDILQVILQKEGKKRPHLIKEWSFYHYIGGAVRAILKVF